jgi:quinol monooxygenase YgiN
MLIMHIHLTVNDAADVDLVRGLLTEQARLSRLEPGCILFDAFQSNNDPKRFMLHERWESQAALDEHRKATAYTTIYAPQVLPKVTREAHPVTLLG